MKTLSPPQFNWGIFVITILLVRALFPEISMICYFALILSLHQFGLLFISIGRIIPTRYLLGSFMCLQFFIGPVFAYNGLEQYEYRLYKMQIPEAEYFSYAMPAVLSFIAGLHIKAGNFKGEILNEKKIALFADNNSNLSYVLIGVGFVASMAIRSFSAITFILYLLGNFKYIGLFMVVLGNKQIKTVPLIVMISFIVSSSINETMFHDLLTWILFGGAVFAIKFKFGLNQKLIACASFIILAVIIQQLKGTFRQAVYNGGQSADLGTFFNAYDAQSNESHSIFSLTSLAPNVVRINQGFIITRVLRMVPDRVPYANGEEMEEILEAAFLPRFLDQSKLVAGDRSLLEKYSGMHLEAGTSMALSSLGDAYINFGLWGGCMFMFLLGLTYSAILNYFYKLSLKRSVILLFLPIIFYYPIRPDCELQTILGHLVKATLLILAVVFYWKGVFLDETYVEKPKPVLLSA